MPKNSNLPDADAIPPPFPASIRDQLSPLMLLTSIFFTNFLARIILAPLMPAVETDLGIRHAEGGSLFLLVSFGYFAALLASGLINSRLTHKQTIVGSNIALGLALLATSFSTGLWGMRLGLIMVGMATGPYIPSGMATLTTLIRSRDWGKAIGIHELAKKLGAPTALSEIGITEADLDKAAQVATETPVNNPEPVTTERVRKLLENALQGRIPSPIE